MKHHGNFESVAEWLQAIHNREPVAIMPSSLAGQALGETTNSITKKLKRSLIPAVAIGGNSYVSADYVYNEMQKATEILNQVRMILVRIARRKQVIFYGDLMSQVGMRWQSPPDRKKIGIILGEISRASYVRDRILLTSIVHRKNPQPTSPGPGYVDLVQLLLNDPSGLFSGIYFDEEDQQGMLDRHMQAVWDHYGSSED